MELALGKYKHFKGNLYEVMGIAKNSENLEEYVIYKALYDNEDMQYGALWIRPKTMFCETIVREGKEFKRFEFVGTVE
ncbi:MAG TPA: DUF1653 domain-containing protein [Clostridiales bacterium]|nr:MAG: hypothetical protein A2Y22_05945 [Clostridiales bacterium GWD2_32_59]HAN09592.1 DUF1653 domain-containing protein [Clostridiales bacterium]